MKGGMLPDGTTTNSNEEYIDTWRKFSDPIEEIAGLHAWAFDPGVSFKSNDGRRNINLPNWFIQKINDFYYAHNETSDSG